MSFGDLKVQDLIYEDSSNNEITVVIADLATKSNPTFTGIVTVPTAPASDVSTKAASTAFVDAYYATKSGASFTGAVTGTDLTLSGNLVVNGTTTTINTQTLDVEDINITLGKVSTPSDTTANNGGLTLKGSSDKTFNWLNATDAWTSSEHIEIASGKDFRVNGNNVLSQTTLGSTVVSSSLTSLGTLTGLTVTGDVTFDSATNAGKDIVWDESSSELKFDHANANSESARAMFGGDGSTRLLIYHDASGKGIVKNENADLILGTNSAGNVEVNSVADIKLRDGRGADYLKAVRGTGVGDNKVEIYHGNESKKFETTATGVNITGALTINGAALSAAPEVSLVADGAISNNVACNITSAGKVEAITSAAAGSGFVVSGQDATYKVFTWDEEHKLLCCWFNDASDDALKLRVGTPTGTGTSQTITWGSAQTLYTDSQGNSGGYANYRYLGAGYHPDTKFHMICWRPSGIYSIAVKINSSGSVVTKGSPNSFTGGSGNSIGNVAITLVPTRGSTVRMSVFYKGPSSGNAQVKYREVTIDPSNGATTETGEIGIMPNGNWNQHSTWADTTNDTTLIGARYNGGGLYYGLIYNGGDTQTQITGSTSDTNPAICHDPVSDKVVFFYLDNSDGGNSLDLRYKIGTYNSTHTSVSWGSELTAITNNVHYDGWNGDMNNYVTYDSLNKKFYLAYKQSNPQKAMLLPFTIHSGGTSIVTETAIELKDEGWRCLTPYADITTGNVYIGMARKSGDSSGQGENEPAAATYYVASTSVTTENFLGWSAAAASDGNTATIKVTGNTVTGLSGLTPGKKYYVQMDGSVGLTPITGKTIEAGVALTSSSLLIR